MKAEKVLCTVALVLVIVGALNWGLESFNLNLVTAIADGLYKLVGSTVDVGVNGERKKTLLEIGIYVLVALSGVVVAFQMYNKKIVACPDDEVHQN